ncbi:unnamed protein product [Lampetra fluviatilis]
MLMLLPPPVPPVVVIGSPESRAEDDRTGLRRIPRLAWGSSFGWSPSARHIFWGRGACGHGPQASSGGTQLPRRCRDTQGPRCTSPWARRERWWGQQPRAVQGWREVAGRLDLLLVAVTQLSLLLGMTTAPPAEATDHAMGTRRSDRADDGRRCCRGGACVVVGRHCTSGGARAGCGCHRPHGRGQTSTDRYSHVAEPTGSPTTTLHATEAVQLPATIFHAVESALAGVAIAHATETAWSKATIFPAGEGA